MMSGKEWTSLLEKKFNWWETYLKMYLEKELIK